jgi:Bacterial PH domain
MPTPAFVPQVTPTGEVHEIVPRIRTNLPDFVQRAILPGEPVLGAFNASMLDHRRGHQLRHDKFVLTDTRIIFYRTSLFHKELSEMPYRSISGVNYNKGFRHGKVTVEGYEWATPSGVVFSGVSNDDAEFIQLVIAAVLRGSKLVASEADSSIPAAGKKR